jgi:outer membrane biosynthesis protein TonB
MARSKKSETQATTAEEGMTMILDTPVEKSIDEAAKLVGVAEIRLLEMFSERLQQPEAMGWETVPIEHEGLLAEFKQQQDAFNSVRSLEPEKEVAPEPPTTQPQAQEEPPIVEAEPQPKKKRGRPPKQSTALTQQKSEAIQGNRENAAQTQLGIAESLTILSAQEGLQDGANAATAYLHGLVTNMTNVKGQGVTVIVAEMLQRTANKSGFNPDEVLEKIGVPLSSQTRETLNDLMGQVLGKAQAATEEMTDTAWGNGYSVQDELTRLKNLMNLSD